MSGIHPNLLAIIEAWLAEHKSGQIVLNADDHAVKSYEFTVRGKVDTGTHAICNQVDGKGGLCLLPEGHLITHRFDLFPHLT